MIKFKDILKEIKVNKPNPNYSFQELKDLVNISNHPPLKKSKFTKKEAEKRLQELGFYDEEGQIMTMNFKKGFRTNDGKTLDDLNFWYQG